MSEQMPEIPSRARSFPNCSWRTRASAFAATRHLVLQRLLQARGRHARRPTTSSAEGTVGDDLHRLPREAHRAVRDGRGRPDGREAQDDDDGACLLRRRQGLRRLHGPADGLPLLPARLLALHPRAPRRTSSTTRWCRGALQGARGGPRAHHRRVPRRAGRAGVRRRQPGVVPAAAQEALRRPDGRPPAAREPAALLPRLLRRRPLPPLRPVGQLQATYALDAEVYAMLEHDDVALLRFGFRLLRQVLFGERTIDEQPRPGRSGRRNEPRCGRRHAGREAALAGAAGGTHAGGDHGKTEGS